MTPEDLTQALDELLDCYPDLDVDNMVIDQFDEPTAGPSNSMTKLHERPAINPAILMMTETRQQTMTVDSEQSDIDVGTSENCVESMDESVTKQVDSTKWYEPGHVEIVDISDASGEEEKIEKPSVSESEKYYVMKEGRDSLKVTLKRVKKGWKCKHSKQSAVKEQLKECYVSVKQLTEKELKSM